jgi:hypothetical protein
VVEATTILFLGKVHKPPSNYHQIDNVPPKLSIVTMSPLNYQNIVNDPLNDETTLSKKKILKLLKKKLKKKNLKIQRVENEKLKKQNLFI